MGCVEERPRGANFRAVCWEDAGEVRRWLSVLREQVDDLHAAARDQVRKKRRRVLSRYEAGRTIRAAGRAITELLDAAEAGLTPPPPLEPLPHLSSASSEEEEAPSSGRRATHPAPGSEGA
jgi:hypothetical protein